MDFKSSALEINFNNTFCRDAMGKRNNPRHVTAVRALILYSVRIFVYSIKKEMVNKWGKRLHSTYFVTFIDKIRNTMLKFNVQ